MGKRGWPDWATLAEGERPLIPPPLLPSSGVNVASPYPSFLQERPLGRNKLEVPPAQQRFIMDQLFGAVRPEAGETRILVTGSSGFIGSALAAILTRDALPKTKLNFDLDLDHGRNLQRMEDCLLVVKDFQPHIVYHLGALADVEECQRSPLEATLSNYQGTWNLLTALEQSCKRRPVFVYTSTMQALGDRHSPRYNPSSPKQTNAYAYTKYMAEVLVESYYKAWGSSHWGIVRLGNVYGPGSRCVLDKWIRAYKAGQPLRVAECDDLSSPVRSYVHVEAVAKALRCLPNFILSDYTGEPYYLGEAVVSLSEVQEFFNSTLDKLGRTRPVWESFPLPHYQPRASFVRTSEVFRPILRDCPWLFSYIKEALV